MSSGEWAVIIWAITAGLGVAFSCAMMLTRYHGLRKLKREPGNGDRKGRIFIAHQDIRRSLLRFLGFMAAFVVGLVFVIVQRTDWLIPPPGWLRWVIENSAWLLVLMLVLMTINEMADRWSLQRLHQMYRERKEQH